MNPLRERAKQHLPTVLLTLSSIVQALALELLWGKFIEYEDLISWSAENLAVWLQLSATFTGIVLVWVLYANNLMRFRWVPDTLDSLAPFLVGVLQFILVSWIGLTAVGKWLMALALIFAIMTVVMQRVMRAARLDPDNAEFFKSRNPATWRDFVDVITISATMFTAGLIVFVTNYTGVGVHVMLAVSWGLLLMQLYRAHKFWVASVAPEEPTS